jgi:hypothetical protein
MRAGLVVSAVGHAGLIALAIVGIGMTRPFDAQPVESIAVDLISIEEFSNIRKGVLDSTVVETETPSIVDTETPAEVAQPTGNTEENQTTPEDTETVTPAPTQETAPAPVPEPTPEPVVEPEPAPAPEPEPTPAPEPPPVPEPTPEPEPAPEPVAPAAELAAPTPSEDPSSIAPQPAVRTASLEEKRADFKKKREAAEKKKKDDAAAEKKKKEDDAKKEAERIREAKRKEDEAARLADEVANIINTEESRGATTGAGGQATLGKETGTAARLSQSEIDALVGQIRGCLSVPLGAAEARITATLEFSIQGNGMVTVMPSVVAAPPDQLGRALASAAQRAVMRCGPYTVAAGQQVRAMFDPSQF